MARRSRGVCGSAKSSASSCRLRPSVLRWFLISWMKPPASSASSARCSVGCIGDSPQVDGHRDAEALRSGVRSRDPCRSTRSPRALATNADPATARRSPPRLAAALAVAAIAAAVATVPAIAPVFARRAASSGAAVVAAVAGPAAATAPCATASPGPGRRWRSPSPDACRRPCSTSSTRPTYLSSSSLMWHRPSPGQDLDERAEVLDRRHLALVDLADLDLLGQRLDLGAGPPRPRRRRCARCTPCRRPRCRSWPRSIPGCP